MSGNTYNVAINPMDTSYIVDNLALKKQGEKLPTLIFGEEMLKEMDKLPNVTPMDMFNSIVSSINEQLQMRYVLMPQIDLNPLVHTDTNAAKKSRAVNIPADEAFDIIMGYVFKDEGGYVNHPKDPGGATNMGITQRTYDGYCKLKNIPTKSVKDLTKEEAKQVYFELFWEASGAKEIAEKGDAKLAYVVFDTAIHSGIPRAKKLLAKSGGDADKMLDNRLDWLQGLRNWKTFGRGWGNRIAKIESRIDNMGGQKEYLA